MPKGMKASVCMECFKTGTAKQIINHECTGGKRNMKLNLLPITHKSKNTVSYSCIGTKIMTARRQAGLTQDQLASQVGCGRVHITKLENDIEYPSLFMLKEIADTLGMRKVQNAICEILEEE